MKSTEVTNLDLYKALCVIKATCRNFPNTCEGCPLSIEIPKMGMNNKEYPYIACRVHNTRYPNISRPDTWKLKPPPTDYTPFDDE